MAEQRAQWGSRLGFVLAAAGSAIGLGNIWKFPYITGEYGGGWFVIIYLLCIVLVGLPIMMAEIFVGRTTQKSPVGAFRAMSGPASPWMGVGWLGVLTAFVILSFYSVVAGWSLHYVWLSITNSFAGRSPEEVGITFESLVADTGMSTFWHVLFMAVTIVIVMGGVKKGIERAARILMPALGVMLLVLLVRGMFTEGFGEGLNFVFGFHKDKLSAIGVLEALGHSFFTLSLGMGAMITYGSYLRHQDDLVTTSIAVTVLDTVIALLACLVIFPVVFSFDLEPGAGPGLVFATLPNAFNQLPGGAFWSTLFFLLLAFAALTSMVSLLEVAVSYFIDELKWPRVVATLACGIVILLLGIPSALSGGTALFGEHFQSLTAPLAPVGFAEGGMNWLDFMDQLASAWLLPLGGLGIALFVAWRVGGTARREAFVAGTRFGQLYWGWVLLLRFLVPLAVILIILNAVGLLDFLAPETPAA